jgi:hypothetical protein
MRFAVGWWRPTRRASSASWRRMLVRRTGATAFLRCGARFARRCSDTHAWRRSHQGQNPSGAKALVSSSISRRSSSGGFETVRITFTGSDALTRAVSGITEAWRSRKVAVDWNLLQFDPEQRDHAVGLALDRHQIQSAPEYKANAAPAKMLGPPWMRPPSRVAGEE